MEQKSFSLINKGMNRDLSISKVGESNAYENLNIRITVDDRDSLLSVTNERGSRTLFDVSTYPFSGKVVGWNVINNHVVLFAHNEPQGGSPVDYIYRVDYDVSANTFSRTELFHGDLGFTNSTQIDSVVYAETDDIQKVYWVDGVHVLRSLNITASASEIASWIGHNDAFDSNRQAASGLTVSIEKTDRGNSRPNGVCQYLATYYNKHDHETGYVWISDLVYLSPLGYGGDKDSTNNNEVYLNISGIDTSFDYIRIYSIFRSSLNGDTVAYIISDNEINGNTSLTIKDDGVHITSEDVTKLLYLGSLPVIAGTIEHKDNTLFLGDIHSIGRGSYTTLESAIRSNMIDSREGYGWHSTAITFVYSNNATDGIHDIPYVDNIGLYPYNNQLSLTSSEILTFKGGEKYRFALKFQTSDGVDTDAFWIGDEINSLYPYIDKNTNTIKRVVAQCTLPAAVVTAIKSAGLKTVRLMIAEASEADRSVKAQGVINPTVFNVYERYKNRLFAMPSWISRPRGSNFASRHFEAIRRSDSSSGEIQCNYWTNEAGEKSPYYQVVLNGTVPVYKETFDGVLDYTHLMIIYGIYIGEKGLVNGENTYPGSATLRVVIGKSFNATGEAAINDFNFTSHATDWVADYVGYGDSKYHYTTSDYSLIQYGKSFDTVRRSNRSTLEGVLYNSIKMFLLEEIGILEDRIVSLDYFTSWAENSYENSGTYYYSRQIHNKSSLGEATEGAVADYQTTPLSGRWMRSSATDYGGYTGAESPSVYKRNLIFVDESIVTLDSPELAYNAVNLSGSGYNFRIIGASVFSSVISDYTVDATKSDASGNSLETINTAVHRDSDEIIDGLTAWPLWRDHELSVKPDSQSKDIKDRVASDYSYELSNRIIDYWLYMWNHSNSISEFTVDDDNSQQSTKGILNSKVFANLRFAYNTVYFATHKTINTDEIHEVYDGSDQYYSLSYNERNRYYCGKPQLQLIMPGSAKYPIYYSLGQNDSIGVQISPSNVSLYSQSPVLIEYATENHAVISLSKNSQKQTILPYLFDSEIIDYSSENAVAKLKLPWEEVYNDSLPVVSFIDNVLIGTSQSYSIQYPVVTVSNDDGTTAQFQYGTALDNRVNADRLIINWFRAYSLFGSNDPDNEYFELRDASNIYLVRYSEVSVIITPISENVFTGIIMGRAHYIKKATIGDTSSTVNCCAVKVTKNTNNIYILDTSTLLSTGVYNSGNNTFTPSPSSSSNTGYDVSQDYVNPIPNNNDAVLLSNRDNYLLIGEIYKDMDPSYDYGGTSDSAIANNRFITAGQAFNVSDMTSGQSAVIYGNQGDAYFQRWDAMRVKPYNNGSVNGVIDITSVMLETHINLDGRVDKQRDNRLLASTDVNSFGRINDVYSQKNNFVVSRDSDDASQTDKYRSSITWTLPKVDLADIDEWTHITLASSLNLDADKGICRALKRFRNSLLAFQDYGISEILYNSRTQLSTVEGVPIELANSGKVDGKNYLSTTNGCINKKSIVEGKDALYFVDAINKSFCSFNGSGITDLSSRLFFDAWFRSHSGDTLRLFFDRILSDVYILGTANTSDTALAYNEKIGAFTSFYSYDYQVDMMTNFVNRFVGYRAGHFAAFHEGHYCRYFGTTYPFYVEYRVAPDVYDKIWTNINYRADFFRVMQSLSYTMTLPAEPSSPDDVASAYREDITFDYFRFFNEYQTTEPETVNGDPNPNYNIHPVKKFRSWNVQIPRAMANLTDNPYGLDRIRNPWIKFIMKKKNNSQNDRTYFMQLHDVIITYFE